MARPPGEIANAIDQFLRTKRRDASVDEIYDAVKKALNADNVASSSVRSYLRLNSLATDSKFERTGHGRYRLRYVG